jgi:hypothetical protein
MFWRHNATAAKGYGRLSASAPNNLQDFQDPVPLNFQNDGQAILYVYRVVMRRSAT